MFSSRHYWEMRYKSGGTSGNGSYGKLAIYKVEFLTEFIKVNNIKTVLELGCGDGNNLKLLASKNPSLQITGVDVSSTAVSLCMEKMPNHSFFLLDDFAPTKHDLVLSLDVLYHLIEDMVYEDYMNLLTSTGSSNLIIYSPDFENNKYAEHVRARKYSEHRSLCENYELVEEIKNKHSIEWDPKGSFSDWKIYKRKS